MGTIRTTHGAFISVAQTGTIFPFAKIKILANTTTSGEPNDLTYLIENLVITRKSFDGTETQIYSGSPDTFEFDFQDTGLSFGRTYTYSFSFDIAKVITSQITNTTTKNWWTENFTLSNLEINPSDTRQIKLKAGFNSGTATAKSSFLDFFKTNGASQRFFCFNGNVKKSYSENYNDWKSSIIYSKGEKVDGGDFAYKSIEGETLPILGKAYALSASGQDDWTKVFSGNSGTVMFSSNGKNKFIDKNKLSLNKKYLIDWQKTASKNAIIFTKLQKKDASSPNKYFIYSWKKSSATINLAKSPASNPDFWEEIPLPSFPQSNDCIQFFLDNNATTGFNERGLTSYDFEQMKIDGEKVSGRKVYSDSKYGHNTYLLRRKSGGIWQTAIAQKDKKNQIWRNDSGAYLKIQLRNGSKMRVLDEGDATTTTSNVVSTTKLTILYEDESASLKFITSEEPSVKTNDGEETGVLLDENGFGIRIYKYASEQAVTLDYAEKNYTPNISLIPVQDSDIPIVYKNDTGKSPVWNFSILVKNSQMANRLSRLANGGKVFIFIPSSWNRKIETGLYGFTSATISRIKRTYNYEVTFSGMQRVQSTLTEPGVWTYGTLKATEEKYRFVLEDFYDYDNLENGWF